MTQFNVYALANVVRIEAGDEVADDPEADADVFFQFDPDTAERVARELIGSAELARSADAVGHLPVNVVGIAEE